jgi:hypothetical protein
MDGILDGKRLDEMKQWKCANGHVMGVYERATVDAKIERRSVRYHTVKLIIFRQAINMEAEPLVDVDAAGTIYGRMLLGFSWRCSVPGCGCVREWNPDDEALDWLKKRFEREQK